MVADNSFANDKFYNYCEKGSNSNPAILSLLKSLKTCFADKGK